MERLTTKLDDGNYIPAATCTIARDGIVDDIDGCKECCDSCGGDCFGCPIQKCFDRLGEYEDLEEQGLLPRLPCKVGDTVYVIGFNNNRPFVYEAIVLSILITGKEIDFNVKVDELKINSQLKNSMFGKTVFLTPKQAEQKLKEMNEHDRE